MWAGGYFPLFQVSQQITNISFKNQLKNIINIVLALFIIHRETYCGILNNYLNTWQYIIAMLLIIELQ